MRPEHKITYRDRMPNTLGETSERFSFSAGPVASKITTAVHEMGCSLVSAIQRFENGCVVSIARADTYDPYGSSPHYAILVGHNDSERQIKAAIKQAIPSIETVQRTFNPRDKISNDEAMARINNRQAFTTALNIRVASPKPTLEDRIAAIEAKIDQLTQGDGK